MGADVVDALRMGPFFAKASKDKLRKGMTEFGPWGGSCFVEHLHPGPHLRLGSWFFAFFRKVLDHTVEVRLKQPVLYDPVFLKLTLSVGLGDFGGHFAGIL